VPLPSPSRQRPLDDRERDQDVLRGRGAEPDRPAQCRTDRALHASIDNLTAEAAPADLLILTYPGRAPVVLSFTGYGISNGDLIIAVPHVNPVDGSPLWLPGTASLSSILDQTA